MHNRQSMKTSSVFRRTWLRASWICTLTLTTLFTTGVLAKPKAHTVYNDETDTFVTTGAINIAVPNRMVGEIAGKYAEYRNWILHEINKSESGNEFSIIFKDVKYLPGGRGGLGIFRVVFDLDWPWPFGAKGRQLDFAILKARSNGMGGIDRILFDLERKKGLLKTFSLDMNSKAVGEQSTVSFVGNVKFHSVVDTFFSLARYRENIEYRIVKAVHNLQHHAETQMNAQPPQKQDDEKP